MSQFTSSDERWMRRAVFLAGKGQGSVEPNPMVGCVVVSGDEVVGEGFHARFGGPHAEVVALERAGQAARGATLYVTLEPCTHFGKTPPCCDAILRAGVARVVLAMRDPFPAVSGGGIARLRDAGVEVLEGLLEVEARRLNAPYLKRLETGRPWIVAKWAMSLDGKIATARGESQWISHPLSRNIGQALRRRVDAVMVGARTARLDNPRLTARPPGPRPTARVVVDWRAELPIDGQLVATAREVPLLVAIGPEADARRAERLQEAGCELVRCEAPSRDKRLLMLLEALGQRSMTNVLVEGGGGLLGALFDLKQVDEVHVFIAPKILGGRQAVSPVAGRGIAQLAAAWQLDDPRIERVGSDIYMYGRILYRGP